MAKLSEFMEKLLEKPDVASEEGQWRIRAKIDNCSDYKAGYNDCIRILEHKAELIENNLLEKSDEAHKKFRNGAGTYYDGISDGYCYAVGMLKELVDEVKMHE